MCSKGRNCGCVNGSAALENEIAALAGKIGPSIIRTRRELHQHPEVGYEEKWTGKFVATRLRKLGIEVKYPVAKTGVLGILRCPSPGKTIAFRADMDALPLTEQTGLPFASKIKGVMHACGHDAHVANLLGVAEILSKVRPSLRGNVKFFFQPSEESGPGGALPMINEGVMEKPHVDAVFGMHCDPTIPTGQFGFRPGVMMANTDSLKITIFGEGGHAARPHKAVDAVVVAAQAVNALQTVVSRRVNPIEPRVLSICTIHGGTKSNVICDKVEMEGTIRTLSAEVREQIPTVIHQILSGVTSANGARFELDVEKGYPSVVNDSKMTEFASGIVRKLYGEKAVFWLSQPMMGGEDFAYFLQKAPGTFIRCGIANRAKHTNYPWHHPMFNVDEDALPNAARLFASIAAEYMLG
jgi:amidohydrolase